MFRRFRPIFRALAILWVIVATLALLVRSRGDGTRDEIFFTLGDGPERAMWVLSSDADGIVVEHGVGWPRESSARWLNADRGRVFGPRLEGIMWPDWPPTPATKRCGPGWSWTSGFALPYTRYTQGVEGAPPDWKAVGNMDFREAATSIPAQRLRVAHAWVLAVLWLPVLGVGGQRLWGHTRRTQRLATGRCLNCGYDLRASTGRCPECGAETQA